MYIGGYEAEDYNFVSDKKKCFIVKDGLGKVVSWKLTNSTTNEEVVSCLKDVKSRLKKKLLYVLVDECCAVRILYQQIFGEDVLVLLDLFHAVQRPMKTIPKRFAHRQLISRKIGMIFRKENDRGSERRETTDCKENILRNLNQTMEDLAGLSKLLCVMTST